MLEAGNAAYALVTDHPDFPKTFHVGDHGLSTDRANLERTAQIWNSYEEQPQWRWYVKPVVVLAQREVVTSELFDE